MRRCAFLTMDNPKSFVIDDELVLPHMLAHGWQVDQVPWRKPTRWDDFEAVIIRTPWDYQQDPAAFVQVLEAIDRSRAVLVNPLELVRWNLRKSYLRKLEAQGVLIPQTVWLSPGEVKRLEESAVELKAQELVIKPLISANADHTYRLRLDELADHMPTLRAAFERREALVQPFLPAVVEEGEFSVFFFGRRYSHAILKTPKAQDFRVQEEHGGVITSVEPEAALMEAALKVIDVTTPDPMYARVDLVRHEGQFLLMELELIEPSLYFRTHPAAPENFAQALDYWIDQAKI